MKFLSAFVAVVPVLSVVLVSAAWAHPGHDDEGTSEAVTFASVSQSSAVLSDSSTARGFTRVPSRATNMPQLDLPVLGGSGKPWTGVPMNNDPMNFQFAIVSDRTGAMRPGIFETAVDKLNLLQPEFVMSVGDLVMGYTAKDTIIDEQWDEFEKIVARLKMPFFYVPGNHDMATPPQQEEWRQRFGPNYYHFRYGDVLFLAMDTEDGGSGVLSQKQVDYFKKALQDNQDVRWTLAFMHRPIWMFDGFKNISADNEDQLKLLKQCGWYEMEEALKGRKHTVYAGHVHSYAKFVRQDSKYFTLATTGGGSGLRGPETHGQFDAVTWITMTDDGPIMANLLLDGILDENIRTNDVAVLVRELTGSTVKAKLSETATLPFSTATLSLRLDNEATMPLTLEFEPPVGDVLRFEPTSATVTVPAGSHKSLDFIVDGSRVISETQLEGLALSWTGTYKPANKPKIQIESSTKIAFDPMRVSTPAAAGTGIDGKFDEWTNLWSVPQSFNRVIGSKRAWGGPGDASVEIASQFDEKFVYVAARIRDDSVVLVQPGEKPKSGDYVELFLSKVQKNNQNATAAKSANKLFRVAVSPSDSESTGVILGQAEQQLDVACARMPNGYQVEVALPLDLWNEGEAWSTFALNVKINDRDVTGSKHAELWWKPEWDLTKKNPVNGLFGRD